MSAVDTHLEKVKDLQMAFKSPVMRNLALDVLRLGLRQELFWPDQISISAVDSEDRNCVGMVYRWLMNVGLIVPTGKFRRSDAEDAKGRKIFEYRLTEAHLARVFLDRNQPAPAPAIEKSEQIGLL